MKREAVGHGSVLTLTMAFALQAMRAIGARAGAIAIDIARFSLSLKAWIGAADTISFLPVVLLKAVIYRHYRRRLLHRGLVYLTIAAVAFAGAPLSVMAQTVQLTESSDDPAIDFTTLGISGLLDWTSGGTLFDRSANSLTFDTTGGGDQTIDMGLGSNVLTLSSGAINFSGSSNALLLGGQVGATDADLFVTSLGTGLFTIGGTIGGGSTNYFQDGTGTVVFSGANSYSGLTTINGGTLRAGAADTFSSYSAVTLADGTVLDLAGFDQTIGSLGGGGDVFLGSGRLTIGGSAPYAFPSGIASTTTYSGSISGTGGITKVGNGTLILSNNASTFSGDIAINGGVLSISDAGQLGTGTSVISVTGSSQLGGNPGYGGGTLRVTGNTSSGPVTLDRGVSLIGRGATSVSNGFALVSIGFNEFAGGISMSAPASDTRIAAVAGNTTISGGLAIGTGNVNYLSGTGNWIISGQVTGSELLQDRFIKNNGLYLSTIWLQNPNNNFMQALRADSSSIRVSTASALGQNYLRGVDLNSSILEIRTDTPESFLTQNVYARGNTNTIVADHGIGNYGDSAYGQTLVMGNYDSDNANLVFAGRDGWNLTLNGSSGPGSIYEWNNGGNSTFTNNSSGKLLLDMSIMHAPDGTTRTTAFVASGDIELTGNILDNPASTRGINFSKTGNGTLTLSYVGPTVPNGSAGTTTIGAGTLSFADVDALPTGDIFIGNGSTTSAALTFTGSEQTLSQAITLNTTTASVFINASGTGALTLSGPLSAVNGNKTLVLGGTNTDDNTLTSVIPSANGTLNIQKIGSGTWVLAGSANNEFTGTTIVSGGTLKLQAAAGNFDILPDAADVIFNIDQFTQSAGGALRYVGAEDAVNTETVGALTAAAGHGVVQALATGSGSATLNFGSLGTRTIGATIDIVNTGTVNIAGTSGFLNAAMYFNGSDFAFSGDGTTIRAPIYDTDAGFVTATTAFTADAHNDLADSFATDSIAIASLRISGSRILTINNGQTLTIGSDSGSGIIQTGGISLIEGFDPIEVSAATNDLTVRVDGVADELTINAPIVGSTAGLTKSGAGTLILSGWNTFGGTVSINEGTLRLAGAGTLGSGLVNLNVRQDAVLDLNGIGIGTINAFNGAGQITNSGTPGATLRVGSGNAAGYFTGLITGPMSFMKAGSGTLSLTGENTFTGATTIQGGTLRVTTLADIGSPSSIGAGDASDDATNAASLVFSNGTLMYTGASTVTYQNTATPTVSIDRLFTLAGNGAIDSSGQYGAAIMGTGGNNNAALVFRNTGDVVFGGTGARVLTLSGTSLGDNQMRIHLIDNGADALSITKSGGGLWILNPATSNTYSGDTTISGGALQVPDAAALVQGLSANSNLTINGGVLQTSGIFSRTIGTDAGQIRFTANGGFAASYEKLVVNLDGPLNMGTAPTNLSTLILSSTTAIADVEFASNIDLGTAARTIQVDDNSTTGLDFATISGVISGGDGSSLMKTGNGTLFLGDANTYVGDTIINGGYLVVTSIGNATGTVSSSLGASGGSYNYRSNGSNLLYVGPGEVASRPFNFIGSGNITARIDSSGSGPLVLTGEFTNTNNGTVTFDLRGSNTDGNILANSTPLADNGSNKLSITKNESGVWILAPSVANTFTGTITISAGSLGVTAAGVGDAGGITMVNSGLFAYGGPVTLATEITLGSNSTAADFYGIYDLTLNAGPSGNALYGQSVNNGNTVYLVNNLDQGATLTINGDYLSLEASANNKPLAFRGVGDTVFNGVIKDAAGTSNTLLSVALDSEATLTLNNTNTYSAGTTLTDGILVLGAAGALGTGTFAFNGGTLITTVPGGTTINNAVQILASPPRVAGTNSITFAGGVALNSSRNIVNDLTGGAQLVISGSGITNTTSATFGFVGTGDTLISGAYNAGSGTSNLFNYGTGRIELTAANSAKGILSAMRGTISLSGASGSWTAGTIAVAPNGTLVLDNSSGDNGNRLSNTSAVAFNGGTFQFITDGVASTETIGAVTLNLTKTGIVVSGGGTSTITMASLALSGNAGSLDLSGVPDLGGANQVLVAASLPTNALINGVMPRVFIEGDTFVTYGASGFAPLTSYSTADLATTVATDNLSFTASDSTTGSVSANSLRLNGNDIHLGGEFADTLTLTSNAILNAGGNNSIDIPFLRFTNGLPISFQVQSGTTLEINSTMQSTNNGLNKALGGTLVLNAPSFTNGQTVVMDGTLRLNGGVNTLNANQTLLVDAGATLDLYGNAQFVNTLGNANLTSVPGAMGTITSTVGVGTLATYNASHSVFSGQMTGSMNFARSAYNANFTLVMPQTYTGWTVLMGGNTILENDATLLDTSAIELNYAALTLSNNTNLQTQINDRIGDAIPLTLRGGTLTANARLSTAAYEKLGALTLLEGASTITSNYGGGTVSSMDLTFASLTRNAGATVNFTGNSQLGQQGRTSRIYVTQALPTILGGALGPWAIANSTDFAAYNAGNGVGVVGQGGFVGFTNTFASGNITELASNLNYSDPSGYSYNLATNFSGDVRTGMLKLSGAYATDITFQDANSRLIIEQGGLLRSNNPASTSIGTVDVRGRLTAGTQSSGVEELVVYNNNDAVITNYSIVLNSASDTITMSHTGLVVGMTLANANLAPGTTIVSLIPASNGTIGNQVVLSQAPLNTISGQALTTGSYVLGTTTAGTNTLTMNSTVGIVPGMTITNPNIPQGSFVVSVDGPTQVTISQDAINTATSQNFNVGVSNMMINSVIEDNGLGNQVRLVKSGLGDLNISAANTYTGGTVVNQGTLNLNAVIAGTVVVPGDLTINGSGRVTMNSTAGQISPTSLVTMNGSAILDLYGDNTVRGLVLNNVGGQASNNLTINTFFAATSTQTTSVEGGGGILTLASDGIIASAPNVAGINFISGRIAFATQQVVDVAPIGVNGVELNPFIAALQLQGVMPSAGGIDKTGDGLLQFGGQALYTGDTNVLAGGIRIGANLAGARYSTLNLAAAGTTLNLAGANTTFGALAGSGTVYNTGGNVTLTTGFNNASTTFSGSFVRYLDNALSSVSLQKVGSGTMTLTGIQDAATASGGSFTINGGGVTFAENGQWFIGQTAPYTLSENFYINAGATLTLDNTLVNVNSRLGLGGATRDGSGTVVGTFNLNGGTLRILGSSVESTLEYIPTLQMSTAGSRVDLAAGSGTQLLLSLGVMSNRSSSNSGVFTGINGAALDEPGTARVTATTATFYGANGTNGSNNMSIRPDIIADTVFGGMGTGFLVRDSDTSSFRPLRDSELQGAVTLWNSNINGGLFEDQILNIVSARIGSITTGGRLLASSDPSVTTLSTGVFINATASEPAFGAYYRNGTFQSLNYNLGGILIRPDTFDGSPVDTTVNINFGALLAGTNPYIHVQTNATLNINGFFYGGGLNNVDFYGILKADGGTLNLNERYITRFLNSNPVTVNGGTLNLNSGYDYTIPANPNYTATTGYAALGMATLNVNGLDSVLDLRGHDQGFNTINSINPLPGYGGTIRTTGGDATLLSIGGGTYAGVLADGSDGSKLSFIRSGNNTTLLTAAATYTGSTVIRGGNLQLRDSGSIAGSSSVSIQFGTLIIDNSGLNPAGDPEPRRISPTAPVTMQGGTLRVTAGSSMNSTVDIATLSLTGGGNYFNPIVLANQGAVNTINIGDLRLAEMIAAGGTLNITGGNNSGSGSFIGLLGINQAQVFASLIDGNAPVANTFMDPHVIMNYNEYASYVPGLGFVVLQAAGAVTNVPTYTGVLASGDDTPDAVNYNNANLTLSTNTTTGSLKFGINSNIGISFANSAVTLNLATGGLLSANNNNSIFFGSTGTRGRITTGGTATGGTIDLVTHQTQNITTINSVIVDNGLGATTRLVKSGPGTLTLTANNTYSGGTVINQGTVNLSGTGVVIPSAGGLTINNATVTQNTHNGQIAVDTDVTINGGGILNLALAGGTNTLSSITFNSSGSTVAPAVNINDGTLTLTSNDAIVSINDNFGLVPIISKNGTSSSTSTAGVGTVVLTGSAPVINVGGTAPIGLTIVSLLDAGTSTLTKTGSGTLALTSGSAITAGAFNLDQGMVIVGSTTTASTALNNPLGAGTLTIGSVGDAGITAITTASTGTTFGNAVTLAGNLTIGGSATTHSIQFTNNVAFGTGTRTIDIVSPMVTLTISGAAAVTTDTAGGTDFLVKSGLGTLVLNQAPLSWNGAGVWIKEGLLRVAPGASGSVIASGSPLRIDAGAGFDLNGIAQTLVKLNDGAVGSGGFITNSATATGTSVVLTIDSAFGDDSYFSGAITDMATSNVTVGRIALTKTGAGTLTLGGQSSYSGTTIVDQGTLVVDGTIAATFTGTNVVVNSGAVLSGRGTIGTDVNGIPTSVVVAGGADLDFRDSVVDDLRILTPVSSSTNLTLGDASARSNIFVDLDLTGTTPAVDRIDIDGNFKLDGLGAYVVLNPIGGQLPGGFGSIPLIVFNGYDASSTGAIVLDPNSATKFAGTEYSLNTTYTNQITLDFDRIPDPADAYWKGGVTESVTSWNSFAAGTSDTNFFTTAAATENTFQVPGATTNVHFAASGFTVANLATTLDGDFTVNSLNFSSVTDVNPISIAPGSTATNKLTIQAAAASGNPASRGITIAAGTQSPISITSDIVLGASQTWLNDGTGTFSVGGTTVTGSAMRLVIDGSGQTEISASLQMSGGDNTAYEFAKLGSGKLTLSGDNTYTVPTTIDEGTLEIAGNGTLGYGNGTVTIGDGAVLQFNQSASVRVDNYIKSSDVSPGDHGRLLQIGTGTTILANYNMQFYGSATVSQGTLVSVDAGAAGVGALVSTSQVTVGATSGSAVLAAAGSIPVLDIQRGGVLSPGSSATGNNEVVGKLEVSSQAIFAAGSTFRFQFLGGLHSFDGSGTVGFDDQAGQLAAAQSGAWDLLTAVALDLSGVDANDRITLELISMSDPSTPGENTGFGATTPFDPNVEPGGLNTMHWLFATTGNVTLNGTAIDPAQINDYFNINATQVTPPLSSGINGSFYVTLVGSDLYLNYAAVPEPGSLLLVGIAGIGFGLRWRKRRLKLDADAAEAVLA